MTEGVALGIDFGTKRMGFAVSDAFGWTAKPLEVWRRRDFEADLAHVREIIEAHEVTRVVIGVPFRLDGSQGTSAERALAFIEALRAGLPDVPIDTQDEALTTFEAQEQMRARGLSRDEQKAWVDAYAAAVILQEDLDRRGTGIAPPGA